MPDLPSTEELLAVAVEALGGSPRSGQQAMARAVQEAVDAGEHLVVQAGTGTGKSLGYLVPLVRRAVAEGKPAVVSTATLALQAQLVAHDLPALRDALAPELGRPFTFGLVKGRSNYVCVHKVAGGFPADEEPDSLFELAPLPGQVVTPPTSATRLGKDVVRLREWAAKTKTGDRDDLTVGVGDRAWREVSVTSRECLGGKCPMVDDCFVEISRAKAKTVDLVVTNHALLAVDAFEDRAILPEYGVLAVDEAHELVDRVTSVVSAQLSPGMVTAAASRAGKNGGDAHRLATAADDLAEALTDLEQQRYPDGLPDHVVTVVEMVASAAREVLTSLRQGSSAAEKGDGGVQQARAAVQEVMDVADRLVSGWTHDVIWYHESEVGSSVRRTLNVAPLGVAHLLSGRLLQAEPPVILTSATLTIGGTFDAVTRQLGLTLLKDRAYRTEDVGSPFDYGKQGILYVARHLPPPGRGGPSPQTLDEIATLVTAAGGRTLGLFSSRRAAQEAAEQLRERLDVPILCQGEDAMAALVRRFRDDPATCLFGTLTLWQGVDVPGPSCSLVIVDRLPFPRPDDPLMAARSEAVSRAGGNGFMAVSAHYAALRLAQGAGRLIRRDTDRGVVAVLDSRLATARYGEFIARSLPPMWRTTDRSLAAGALERLRDA